MAGKTRKPLLPNGKTGAGVADTTNHKRVICARLGDENGLGKMRQHPVSPRPKPNRKGFDLMDDATPTSLYRYYDSRGVLLYVGITSRGISRNVEHNTSQPWWKYVARQDVDHFDNRPAALTAEKKLIRSSRPPFNKQHNPDHGGLADAYLRLQLLDPADGMTAGPIMHRNKGRLRMDIKSYDGELMVCRAFKSDLPLSARINRGACGFNTFALPELGLRGHVTNWDRPRYLLEMTLRAAWLDRVKGVRTLVDKKKIGYFIRTVEFQIDGEWVPAKPQGFSDPYAGDA